MAQPTPPGKRELLPYAGFLLAVGGMIWQGGQMSARLDQTVDRVTQLEARNRENATKLDEINIRGERSVAKLDFLVQQQQRRSDK